MLRADPDERPAAPSGLRALHDLLRSGSYRASDLDALAQEHPGYRLPILTIAAALRYAEDDHSEDNLRVLSELFEHCADPATHPFFTTHLAGASHVRVPVTTAMSIVLPFSREAVGLMLADLRRGTGRTDLAIEVAERIAVGPFIALYLAALYLDADRNGDVLALTADVDRGDDVTALLLTLRGTALTRLGMVEAARDVLNTVLAPRTGTAGVRHLALRQRSELHATCGRHAQARRDLERILDDDPGDTDAVQRLAQLAGS